MGKRKNKHFLVIEEKQDDAFFIVRAFRSIPFCTAFTARNEGEAKAYILGSGIYGDRLNYPYPDGVLIGVHQMSRLGPIIDSLGHAIEGLPIFVLTSSTHDADEFRVRRVKMLIERPMSIEGLRELLQRLVADLCEETPPSSPDL